MTVTLSVPLGVAKATPPEEQPTAPAMPMESAPTPTIKSNALHPLETRVRLVRRYTISNSNPDGIAIHQTTPLTVVVCGAWLIVTENCVVAGGYVNEDVLALIAICPGEKTQRA